MKKKTARPGDVLVFFTGQQEIEEVRFFQWGFSMGLMDVVFFLLWLLCVFVGGKVDYMVGGNKSSYLLFCKFVRCW